MALPALFAACADDNFTSQSNPSNAQGEFITLPTNFALVQDNAETKGAWNTNGDMTGSFYWMPELMEGSADTYEPDRIGLAWTGVSLKEDDTVDPVGSALTSYSDRVFTNYKFEHFAWRIVGEELKADPCTPNTWESGAELLQDEYFTADWKKGSESLPAYVEKDKLKEGNVDYHTGLFNTDNSTVYAGQYIVYAPYDAENVSNYIIASSKNVYDGAYLYNDKGEETSDATTKGKVWEYNDIFVYGTTAVGGGDQLTTFSTNNLHGYVSLALKGAGNIKKVILYDAKGRLLTKVGLSAKGIYDGKEGKDLYLAAGVAERETTKTITVNMEKRGNSTAAYPALKKDENSRVLIPVLPTESALDNVEIILVNEDDQAFRTKVPSLSITDNKTTAIEINNVDFTNAGVLVTDEIALRVATGNQKDRNRVQKESFASENAEELKAVELLGDIELTTTLAIRGNYTLNGGRIIIPGNNGETVSGYGNAAELRMVVHNNSGEPAVVNPVINSDILVKAAGCCAEFGGSLIVGNATINGNVETESQASYADFENYEDDLSSDKSKHGMVKFNVTGATTTFAGKLVNNGRLDFGRSDRGESIGSGKREAANVNVMANASIVNNNQMTIFRFVENGKENSQASPYVYVYKGGELTNNGEFTIEGKLAHYGSGKNNGVINDRVSSTVTGELINYNAAGAEYICDVNDPGQRFKDAVEGKSKPTTTVRFVEKYATYDFETVDETAKTSIKKYVVAVEPHSGINGVTLKGNMNLTGKDIELESGRLGFEQYKVTVGTGKDATTQNVNSELTVNNITVGAEGKLVMENVNANVASNVTVSGEIYARTGEFNIGSHTQNGTLTINAYKNDGTYQDGYMECALNSVTTVYGNIVNNGRVNIIEAAATEKDIPAYLYYTGSVTGGPQNWIQGGASKMD